MSSRTGLRDAGITDTGRAATMVVERARQPMNC
jgi:hypothetical protein